MLPQYINEALKRVSALKQKGDASSAEELYNQARWYGSWEGYSLPLYESL